MVGVADQQLYVKVLQSVQKCAEAIVWPRDYMAWPLRLGTRMSGLHEVRQVVCCVKCMETVRSL